MEGQVGITLDSDAGRGDRRTMRCAVVVVAAGSGQRSSIGGPPKQFRDLGGRTVLARALAPFLAHPEIDHARAVTRPCDEADYREAVPPDPRLGAPVPGGDRRQESVRRGLAALADDAPDHVLIHDAARPFVTAGLIDRVLDALARHAGAIPALPVADTLKRGALPGRVAETIDRAGLFAAQTPQGFRYRDILEAHARAAAEDLEFTDDAAIAEWAGLEVALVAGETMNRKLTTPDDLAWAEALLAGPEETRTGSGHDVHGFGPGDAVTLCGVTVPHDRTLIGHSDADAGLHALADALYGALAEGDIGAHFPPSESAWAGADSAVFLAHARDRVAARGGRVVHVDVTLVCEAPRIGPHRDAMRERIAGLLQIDVARVSVKATTSEGLGFAGRGEGLAAHATATVALPREAPR